MKFVANGVKYELDDSKLTFAEARAVEKVTGKSMGDIGRTGFDSAEILQAMIWVAMKREDPTLKHSDLDDMAIGDIEMIPEDDEQEASADPVDPPVPGDGEEEGSTPSE